MTFFHPCLCICVTERTPICVSSIRVVNFIQISALPLRLPPGDKEVRVAPHIWMVLGADVVDKVVQRLHVNL